jgi:hypothetical protein
MISFTGFNWLFRPSESKNTSFVDSGLLENSVCKVSFYKEVGKESNILLLAFIQILLLKTLSYSTVR